MQSNHSNLIREDLTRQLLDAAIRGGRTLISPQTEYLHHHYHSAPEEKQDSIPVVENVLYALALFHSRTAEHVAEAKNIITKILHFQNTHEDLSRGNFPIYLHDFPHCKDRFLGVQLIAPFFWILKSYQQVLGPPLKNRLIEVLNALICHCLATDSEKKAPYQLRILIGAGAKAFGQLFCYEELVNKGDHILQQLLEIDGPMAWYSPEYIGDIYVALQMLYPSIENSPWGFFLDYLGQTCNDKTLSYIGPAIREWQVGYEPQATLYDVVLGLLYGSFPKRIWNNPIVLLKGALIRPADDLLKPQESPCAIKKNYLDQHWHIEKQAGSSLCYIEKQDERKHPIERHTHLLKMVWGNGDLAHTFVCQGGNIADVVFVRNGHDLEAFFDLMPPCSSDDKEKMREIIFYFNIAAHGKILVQQVAATTFQLGDAINISMGSKNITMTFSLVEGTGGFFGHIMRGNRPSQVHYKNVQKHEAYDWQIFLRSLNRSENCKIRVLIQCDSR